MQVDWRGGQRRIHIQARIQSLHVDRGPGFHHTVNGLIHSLQENRLGSQALQKVFRDGNACGFGKIYLDLNALLRPRVEFVEFNSGCEVSYPVFERREVGDD